MSVETNNIIGRKYQNAMIKKELDGSEFYWEKERVTLMRLVTHNFNTGNELKIS